MAKRAIDERKVEQQYWVIKTTEGGPRYANHWDDFKREKVVGLGWADIEDDPTEFNSYQEFLDHLKSKHDWNVNHAARTIYRFAKEWQTGDTAIICVGYKPNQVKDVCLYGFAEVGNFYVDLQSKWFTHKRRAKIWPIERYIPVNVFTGVFGGSMLGTINGPFTEKQFREFSKEVESLYPELWQKESFKKKGPVAVDVSEPPLRISVTTARVVRDTATAKQLKASYEYRCQVCGERIEISDRKFYAEVHHIRPLGGEHNGLDEVENMLILCPNHHAMFDFGIPRFLSTEEIKIHQECFSLTCKHKLGKQNVDYYNTKIHKAG